MVDVVTKTAITPEEIMNARVKRVRDMSTVESVLVEPIDGEGFTASDMRELLRHPRAGAFREEGPMLWPNDTFTHRRLKEGSIKLVDSKKEQSDGGKPQIAAGHAEGTERS